VQKELTLQEFYRSDPRRAHSHEVGYGSSWREFAPVPAYRLAWVESTGELYAVELSEADERKDPVEIFGVLWSWPQVEACLAGWRERCGKQRSLLWARERVRRWRPVVEESQFIEDRSVAAHGVARPAVNAWTLCGSGSYRPGREQLLSTRSAPAISGWGLVRRRLAVFARPVAEMVRVQRRGRSRGRAP
jgi:hypothetical protein